VRLESDAGATGRRYSQDDIIKDLQQEKIYSKIYGGNTLRLMTEVERVSASLN
jgi:hypothetical protein